MKNYKIQITLFTRKEQLVFFILLFFIFNFQPRIYQFPSYG